MYKFICRTFFILLVAGLVAGALYIFVNSSPDRAYVLINQIGGLEGRGGFNRAASRSILDPGNPFGASQQGIFLAGFQREFRVGVASWLALLDIVKNLVTIGLITVMVVLLRRSFIAVKGVGKRQSGT